MINKKKLNENRYSKNWTPWKSDTPRINEIIKLVGKNKKVLDIGCYDGTISKLVKDNNNTVYGIDISRRAVKLAKEKGIKAKKYDVEKKLPFPKNSFDVVIAGEIIEHVYDTDYLLREIHRILKRRGELVLTTPNIATLGRRALLLIGKNPLIEINAEKAGGHIRYFVKDSLFWLLKKNKFKIKKFTSDVINFSNSGKLFSTKLAKIFPTLGKTLIVKAIRGR